MNRRPVVRFACTRMQQQQRGAAVYMIINAHFGGRKAPGSWMASNDTVWRQFVEPHWCKHIVSMANREPPLWFDRFQRPLEGQLTGGGMHCVALLSLHYLF